MPDMIRTHAGPPAAGKAGEERAPAELPRQAPRATLGPRAPRRSEWGSSRHTRRRNLRLMLLLLGATPLPPHA